MRVAATLLLAILVAACGTPAAAVPSSVAPSAVAVASPAAAASPVAVASPTPAAEPSSTPVAAPSSSPGGEPVTVQLPVTACATSMGADEAPPSPPATTDVTVAASLVGRIGIYGDGYDLVMGPAGWSCEAQIGADGSTSLRIWSPTDPHAEVATETNGGCYGCALMIACSTFATASAQYAVDFGLCDPQRPPEEQVWAETAELIGFTDPAGVVGTGTGSGWAYDARGLVWYSTDGNSAFASRTTCTLAPFDGDLCGPVFDLVRSLLPAPPPGSSPAAIAALVPPAP